MRKSLKIAAVLPFIMVAACSTDLPSIQDPMGAPPPDDAAIYGGSGNNAYGINGTHPRATAPVVTEAPAKRKLNYGKPITTEGTTNTSASTQTTDTTNNKSATQNTTNYSGTKSAISNNPSFLTPDNDTPATTSSTPTNNQ